MNKFILCVAYLFSIGLLSNLLGDFIPRNRMDYAKKCYQARSWEKDGRIYDHLAIRKWKDRVPDMSKVRSKMLPKRLSENRSSQSLDRLIRETCVAETVHKALILLGSGCILIWRSKGGVLLAVLWALGNCLYIMIQRYNRPRLIRLLAQSGSKISH
ncbi:MAG: hypothetical protein PHR21_10225 [Oscillospiraceae bacterium]|nr:hypothetical protein [Oscillospiraceae bacterium]MDD4367567.1 hypothetical protein [Oscillospiraceae bacterium]